MSNGIEAARLFVKAGADVSEKPEGINQLALLIGQIRQMGLLQDSEARERWEWQGNLLDTTGIIRDIREPIERKSRVYINERASRNLTFAERQTRPVPASTRSRGAGDHGGLKLGGWATSEQSYIVGEERAEELSPGTSGYVHLNAPSGGITINTGDAPLIQAAVTNEADEDRLMRKFWAILNGDRDLVLSQGVP